MTRLGGVNSNSGFGIDSAGAGNLSAGTITINDSRVTANTVIMLTAQGGTLNVGHVWVSARVAGVSFTVTSANPLDARTVGYILIEP